VSRDQTREEAIAELHDSRMRHRELEYQVEALESTNARLVAALTECVKAARYYEREKPGWCPNDDAHDDAIEAAEKALASGGESPDKERS
jgi:hypothetical protein